eukprot:Gregarina_sp_Pseudo_9__3026@NODE_322_length_3156_cov_2914_334617_g302_i0_p6_GENE_NODE_322_length_3156_cov_2914_334617_g302_i0NODE_322_length_3156_cov_2914_334617_g302_i0_p6_ORF_typecomplete_len130_score19_89Minor_capsid_2/PF11114_8/0_17Minor_capsid_2/PF11114_8/96DUF3731/PF12531_8/0_08_NODE_322_length_3156_cov_2914_334617_g302_i012991688
MFTSEAHLKDARSPLASGVLDDTASKCPLASGTLDESETVPSSPSKSPLTSGVVVDTETQESAHHNLPGSKPEELTSSSPTTVSDNRNSTAQEEEINRILAKLEAVAPRDKTLAMYEFCRQLEEQHLVP